MKHLIETAEFKNYMKLYVDKYHVFFDKKRQGATFEECFLAFSDIRKPECEAENFVIECVKRNLQFNKRSEAAKMRESAKRKALFSFIENLEIVIPDYNKEALFCKAKDSYNDRNIDKDAFVGKDAPIEFINRITVNFLRHECTCYEQQIYQMFGKTGKQEAIDRLRERINAAIFKKYPHLI